LRNDNGRSRSFLLVFDQAFGTDTYDKLASRLLERKNALVARKEALLNISAQRQGKEESWDKQTEELAKV
jgi:hypothetical protein